jgi:5-methyltetrahydropteroyltriglutamate--homocysteine methyltransferase
MQPSAFAPGIYPRSEALVQATRDLDRGRTTPQAVEDRFASDLRDLVSVQESAGLALLSDGMLGWQDVFRPLADRSDGLDARPLTRFLDTNTFYRAVLVEGEPRLREPVPAPGLPAGRWLRTLPSPFAFSRATNGAASPEALAANVLAPQVEADLAAGCALVVLYEPFLAPEDVDVLAAAVSKLPDGPYALQLPFVGAAPLLEPLTKLPVDAIGVDFYRTSLDAVPTGYPKRIMAGVVDARSSALEDPRELASFVQALAERAAGGVSLTPNGDLQFVPEPIARRKLDSLGRVQATVQEAVA